MRAARLLVVAALLLTLGVGSASAGENFGIFRDVYGCVNTLLLPPEYTPAGLPELGPDAYKGTLVLELNADGTYRATFSGVREDGAEGSAEAYFEAGWPGVVFGPLIINGQQIQNCITNIGVEYLISAELKGIGKVDGRTRRVNKCEFGAQGELLRFKDVPAPAPFRDWSFLGFIGGT